MSTKTLMTFEQFSQLPEDENKYELDHGELITLPAPAADHEHIKSTVTEILMAFLHGSGLPGKVYPESGFVVDPESYRVPDVAYSRRVERGAKSLSTPPDLAIEVHSPSNSPRYSSP